jgi:hypothetical protein
MTTPSILGLATMTPGVLVSTRIAVTTDSAIYTVPANKAAKLAQGTVCNNSGSACTFGMSIVPSGGTIGDGTHKIIPDSYSLGAGDTLPLGDYIKDHLLGDGDAIAMKAGTGNVLTVVISGAVMA